MTPPTRSNSTRHPPLRCMPWAIHLSNSAISTRGRPNVGLKDGRPYPVFVTHRHVHHGKSQRQSHVAHRVSVAQKQEFPPALPFVSTVMPLTLLSPVMWILFIAFMCVVGIPAILVALIYGSVALGALICVLLKPLHYLVCINKDSKLCVNWPYPTDCSMMNVRQLTACGDSTRMFDAKVDELLDSDIGRLLVAVAVSLVVVAFFYYRAHRASTARLLNDGLPKCKDVVWHA